jgi:hypothetical protein
MGDVRTRSVDAESGLIQSFTRAMEDLLRELLGKKIDVTCGTNAAFRGDVVDVKSGVLYLRDEDEKVAYVAVDKIAVVYECKDPHLRPGFLG